MTLYSFKDLAGVFYHPLTGSFIITGGNIGLGQVTITMATGRTVTDMASDGTAMISYIAGDNGSVAIEVQQTSAFHSYLLNTFNLCKTAADHGDISNWAAARFALRNIVDGSEHTCTGVAFDKVPPKVYAGSGQKITWDMPAAYVINE